MAVHHPLASLATLVVFACVVGALPIGWYGGSYHPLTHPLVPYLGRFSYVSGYPFMTINQGNPFQKYFNMIQSYHPNVEVPDTPTPLISGNKNSKDPIVTVMKWPGWKNVFKDTGDMKKWEKLIRNIGNYTDTNNLEWTNQFRHWTEKQQDNIDLFAKVSGFMAKSSEWEKNIKMWLHFVSVPAPTEYVNAFKTWLKGLVNNRNRNPTNPSFPGGRQPHFPSFPSIPWNPPVVPWHQPWRQTPDFQFDSPGSGFDPRRFDFNKQDPNQPSVRFPQFPQFPQPPSTQPQTPPSRPQQPPFNSPEPPFNSPEPPFNSPELPFNSPESPFNPQQPPFYPQQPLFNPQQPPFYPQQPCYGYDCLNFPSPDLPQFPGGQPPFPFQPQFPMRNDPYFENSGFNENPVYGGGLDFQQPNMDKLPSNNKKKV